MKKYTTKCDVCGHPLGKKVFKSKYLTTAKCEDCKKTETQNLKDFAGELK